MTIPQTSEWPQRKSWDVRCNSREGTHTPTLAAADLNQGAS